MPLKGITFTINATEVRDLVEVVELSLNHPNGGNGFKEADDHQYHYAGGILPGQSVVLRWKERARPPNATTTPTI